MLCDIQCTTVNHVISGRSFQEMSVHGVKHMSGMMHRDEIIIDKLVDRAL